MPYQGIPKQIEKTNIGQLRKLCTTSSIEHIAGSDQSWSSRTADIVALL